MANVCARCGREYDHQPVGTCFVRADNNREGYCSQKCWDEAREKQRKARLDYMRGEGNKVLHKWEKALEKDTKKRKDRIQKLSAAMRGDDPDDIKKAIHGGFFVRFGRNFWLMLKAAIFTIGLICIAYVTIMFFGMVKSSVKDNEKPAEVVNELPPLEETLGTTGSATTPSETNTTSSATDTAPVEGTTTPVNE